jgi:hypothetical protein
MHNPARELTLKDILLQMHWCIAPPFDRIMPVLLVYPHIAVRLLIGLQIMVQLVFAPTGDTMLSTLLMNRVRVTGKSVKILIE